MLQNKTLKETNIYMAQNSIGTPKYLPMDEERNKMFVSSGILFSLKKGNSDTRYNMDEP
jgi:hypothetical protein